MAKILESHKLQPGYRKDKAKTNKALKNWMISDRGDSCEVCGYDKADNLVVHHIVERSKVELMSKRIFF